MTPRGGYRGNKFGKKSRKLPITKVSVYTETREYLNELSDQLKIPVVELLYRIQMHKSTTNIIDDIKKNLPKDWDKEALGLGAPPPN